MCFNRFLALPSLIQAPHDYSRRLRNVPRRRPYEVEPNILLSPHIAHLPDLLYPEEYRLELAWAFSEVFLVQDDAALSSVMEHRPLVQFRDPLRISRARLSCNGQNPVTLHLNPVLAQLGLPPM